MAGRDELYAVLVSLLSDTLLLPNAAVAEVVSAEGLEPPPDGAPPWLTGRVTYNNRQLAVVRFELLNGASSVEDTRRTRLAIVQPMTTALRTGQYAIVCQGYPHLVTLNRTALRKEAIVSGDNEDVVLTRVSIANTTALIPNLERIEQLLAQFEGAPAIA
ncbi:MAG: chemotaxis protein CheW [Nevskiaceae bacterium]